MSARAYLGWILVSLVVGNCGCSTTASRVHSISPKKSPAAVERSADAKAPEDPAAEKRIQAIAHFATGVIQELEQKPESALEQYYQSAMADPLNEELVAEVAQRLVLNKQSEKALALLNLAANQPNASATVYAWQGLAYAQSGKSDQAIRASQTALEKNPRLLLAYQSLTQLYLQAKQNRKAVSLLEAASRSAPADAPYLVDLCGIWMAHSTQLERSGQKIKPRVTALLDRAAKLKSDNPAVLRKLADGYHWTGDYAKASGFLSELMQKFPTMSGLREVLTETLLRGGDKKKAIEQLELLIRDHPTNPRGYFLMGGLLADDKDYGRAAEYVEKALLLDPEFEPAYYQLGVVQLAANQPKAALATLAKARAHFPPSYRLEFYAALAYSQLKDYPQALKCFTAAEVVAKATDPKQLNHSFYFQLAATSERSHDYDQAEKYFRKCLEMAPDDAEAMNYLGYMWAEHGTHLGEARTLIEKALKLEPKNAAFLDSMAWVLFKLGQPKAALDQLLKALENEKEPDATVLDHLGDIYSALRQPEKAREAWRKSLAVEANDAIRKKLEMTPAPPAVPR
jgi:tetratricopeptide (TPR) repeat protein